MGLNSPRGANPVPPARASDIPLRDDQPARPLATQFSAKATNEGVPDYSLIASLPLDCAVAPTCEICGKRAVVVEFDIGRKTLCVSSPIRQFTVACDMVTEVVAALRRNDFRFVHEYLIRRDGLDGYCPECNAMYCCDHWVLVPNFDEGFYEDTTGHCPRGHSRTVDD